MHTGTESPEMRRLRRFALAAIITNIGIVITGGAVRITGSGLGCPTWPTCDGDSFVPRPGGEHTTWQTAIEFGNRLLTFVVLAAAIAVFVQVRRTRPHTRTVELLTWGLPIGILGQVVLGGITVLTGLSPYTVAAHFLLSMVLISIAVALHERVRPGDGHPPAGAGVRHATTALAIVGFIVLILGTITTGAGPHGGDLSAPRFGIDIRLIAIAHADAVWMLVGLTVALVAVTWRSGPPRLRTALRVLLAVELLQGAIGYTQYALGVPQLLVALHVVGAAVMWAVLSAAWIRARPVTSAAGSGDDLDPADIDEPVTGDVPPAGRSGMTTPR
jgi:heme a synthase